MVFVDPIGDVVTPRLGEKYVNVKMTKLATDLLSKAVSMMYESWVSANHDKDETDNAEKLHKDIIALWELFRP